MGTEGINQVYSMARDRYGELDVDTDAVLDRLQCIALSIPCWQGDDVTGFEKEDEGPAGGGIQVTGRYPGRARTPEELRLDLEKAFSCIPGRHRLNLHAMYGEFHGEAVDRDGIESCHYQGWIDWAQEHGLNMDFNATCFSHPRADSGFTLSSRDPSIRSFWIEHVRRCRRISAWIGRELESPCIHNLWIPDGMKDRPADRSGFRNRLRESLDTIFSESYSSTEMKDSVESKLFGIGSEAFVVGSYDFYLGYALGHEKMLCLDLGHFHPTESVEDKLSALLCFTGELLLHVSRGVRWDSDHVVVLDDGVRRLAEEIVACDGLERVHLALDFFDASLHRVGALAVGARAVQKALLLALLRPMDRLKSFEDKEDYFGRLALQEALETLPWGSVWDAFCKRNGVVSDADLIWEIHRYEKEVTAKR
jgi:L-rhamnose isomerase